MFGVAFWSRMPFDSASLNSGLLRRRVPFPADLVRLTEDLLAFAPFCGLCSGRGIARFLVAST